MFLVCFAAAVLILVFFYVSRSGGPRYRADAFIVMRPFKNTVLEPSFERHVRQSFPGVFRLYFQKSVHVRTAAAGSVTNDSMVIQIAVLGNSVEAAQNTANDAAPRICALLRQLYAGTTAEVLNEAHDARPYSSWRDRLKLRLGRRSSVEPTPTLGIVVFTGSGVSLEPGENWKQHYSDTVGLCEPTLVGDGKFKSGFMHAYLLGVDCSDLTAAVAGVRQQFDKDATAIKGSFAEKAITTDSGLHVVCASFSRAYAARGTFMETRQQKYVVTNAQGRFVVISYIAVAKSESEAVNQMIRKSLQLK